MVECIEAADVAICMAGLLTALANTQLTARLKRENRIFPLTWQIQKLNEGELINASLDSISKP